MAQTTEALHCADIPRDDLHVAHTVEDGHTGAEKRGILRRIGLRRDVDSGFGAERAVLCIYTSVSSDRKNTSRTEPPTSAVSRHAIDKLVLAHLEKTPIARLARPIVASVPGPADFVANLEVLDAVAHLHDRANDFVAWNAREGCPVSATVNAADVQMLMKYLQRPKQTLLQENIRVTHAACRHLDQDLIGRGLWDGYFLDGPRRIGTFEHNGATLLGDAGCHIEELDVES